MILSTIWFESSSEFIRWQRRDKKKIFNVHMAYIGTTISISGHNRPDMAICVVYYLTEDDMPTNTGNNTIIQ